MVRVRTTSDSPRVRAEAFDWIVRVLVLLISAAMLYPFLYILAVSLSASDEIHGMNITVYPKGLNFDVYHYIFRLPQIYRAYFNSILYTTIGTVLSIAMTMLCAYPLSKPWLYGKGSIVMFIVVTMFVSGGTIPMFILVKMLHMYDSMWALIVPGLMNTFYMFIALAFFKGIPLDLEEASYIDGAGDANIFTRVFLPLAKPITATLSLFYAVGYWNSWFPAAIFLIDKDKYPIQLLLRNMMVGVAKGQLSVSVVLGETSAAGAINLQSLNYALVVAVILPIILLYPFVQKYFIKGAMIGSLKG
ncbi:carbohydrate ABC transporter permease [Paenibacillus sacheonensis]|uniref:ABC transporter permease subunit n=1 Tax=Paenibacillus sacheonensis TaxID=742054 RepID=A0A7X5BWD6_9BACL|nr:carbohydrate ABC transporter permease [Paenibacillus sacheonensis]MBM7564280.1 putative aldouronate transport system permease protein [Paenibacillus sacheonensis]NBC67397.1 ABC transporter permease subunit [Paenibacillus sacheonensis]